MKEEDTYDFGTFFQADEEVFGDLWHIGVGCDASGLVSGTTGALTLPIDAALDLTLEVARVLPWQQGHLNVAVRVGLQLTLHWLKE